ncbi:hypothetical protein Sjap_017031 [Stephania japonica]|uniref:Uncharacterized protein n=1 Tax=Stephania japonica TaxID=461633 RepID=A0AAP0NLJ1_9MAGN
MAALTSFGISCYTKPRSNPQFSPLCGQIRQTNISFSDPNKDQKVKGEKGASQSISIAKIFAQVAKLGKDLRSNLSPKEKGDWKDVVLMSLSFAVYVYISQKLVCAYCAWISILN